MTARTERDELDDVDPICCAANCGKPGEFRVSVHAWSISDPGKIHGFEKFETNMAVCAAHKLDMPSTTAKFFSHESRARITPLFRSRGKAIPNYDGAEWAFEPMAAPTPGGAN